MVLGSGFSCILILMSSIIHKKFFRGALMPASQGQRFRQALKEEKPLQIVGTVNAYVALMAEKLGYRSLYLSGAGVANSSFGLPDLAVTTLDNVLEEARRITDRVNLPLLVDIDTGWGNSLMIARTMRSMIKAGVAAVHIEDQSADKRCGHREGKKIISINEMVDRIKAAADAKTDEIVLMARTDAFSSEGLDRCIARGIAYCEAGAEMLFPEALHTLEQYREFKRAVKVPVLINLTEFGSTPLFSLQELAKADIDMALYPLSVNRAMNLAAEKMLTEIRRKGTQKAALDSMQTRNELYNYLDYYQFEKKLDGE